MSGFLDHLFDPASSGKKGRDRIRYREKLRTLIQDAPAVRRLTPHDLPFLIHALPATEQVLPTTELVVERVGEAASANRFREWKAEHSHRPIWRLDFVSTEEQVLECRAMGADAFTLDVNRQDLPMLQFLVEVGLDYGLPAIFSCRTAESLALALKVQDGGVLWLRDELLNEALFDLEALRGRIVLIDRVAPLVLQAAWVCGVVQLQQAIEAPPPREPKPERKAEALDAMEGELDATELIGNEIDPLQDLAHDKDKR